MKKLENEALTLSLTQFVSLQVSAGFSSGMPARPNFNWIKLQLIFPDMCLTLSPINKIATFRSALISSFEDRCQALGGEEDEVVTYGYVVGLWGWRRLIGVVDRFLAMDQLNKLHFLMQTDERVTSWSLVGV